ncbi:Kinase superfamily protein isoform 5 [Hibiscus syriacus]|uniref:Kinase superfamily protein isoform 5 n=1 Tax=Hibiscus syriacus TaxID=106335 RepID=A0A6A2WL09_HIBSY|nr:Kinase superfamily protein isoform 5 [Hibiscus syriacus]
MCFFKGFVSVHGERPSAEYAKLRKESLESEFGDIKERAARIFADISPEPIAAASIGQVYKAHLHSGELVAVKVQRPGMSLLLTLDALLFHMIGGQLKRFAKARKDLLVAVNEVVRHMFDEIDYILEARNAERFASLYGDCPNGIKLTDETALKEACLNQRELIDQGLYCSLRQLLEVGFFHADPHPETFLQQAVAPLHLDFGMMGDIPRHYRVGLIQVLVHFVNRDSLGLANDFHSLGFIPEGVDIQSVADTLQTSFRQGYFHEVVFVLISSCFSQLVHFVNRDSLGLANDFHSLGFIPEGVDIQSVADTLQTSFDKGTRQSQDFQVEPPRALGRLSLFVLEMQTSPYASELSEEPTKADDKGFASLGMESFDMRSTIQFGQVISGLDHSVQTRVISGFGSLRAAVKLAPEVWTPMFIRLALNPQTHSFLADLISALMMRLNNKVPETFWLCVRYVLPLTTDATASEG